MSSSFTLGDGDGPRPTPPPSGDPQLPAPCLLVEPGRAGAATDTSLDTSESWSPPTTPRGSIRIGRQAEISFSGDLTAPVDDLHEQCVAATLHIRTSFNRAHADVEAGAARFQADIDRIVAAGEQTGWESVTGLAARGRASESWSPPTTPRGSIRIGRPATISFTDRLQPS